MSWMRAPTHDPTTHSAAHCGQPCAREPKHRSRTPIPQATSRSRQQQWRKLIATCVYESRTHQPKNLVTCGETQLWWSQASAWITRISSCGRGDCRRKLTHAAAENEAVISVHSRNLVSASSVYVHYTHTVQLCTSSRAPANTRAAVGCSPRHLCAVATLTSRHAH